MIMKKNYLVLKVITKLREERIRASKDYIAAIRDIQENSTDIILLEMCDTVELINNSNEEIKCVTLQNDTDLFVLDFEIGLCKIWYKKEKMLRYMNKSNKKYIKLKNVGKLLEIEFNLSYNNVQNLIENGVI